MAETQQNSSVVAVFDKREEADKAVRALVDAGFSRQSISMITGNEKAASDVPSFQTLEEKTSDGTTVGENAFGGAAVGAAGGLLLALGALAIPGLGPVLAAGPIAAMFAGAAVGTAGGGIIGAFKDYGVPDEEASTMAEVLKRGGTLVTVHTDNSNSDRVADILDAHNAVDLDARAESLLSVDLQGTSPTPSSTPAASAPSTAQQGTGRRYARSYRSSYPTSTMGDPDVDQDFRTHFASTFGNVGSYDEYAPAYRYGYTAALHPDYTGRTYEDVEDTLRTDYLRNNLNSTWDQAKGSVRYGWEKVTGKRQ